MLQFFPPFKCTDFLKYVRELRDEVKGEWRKLHNEELSDLYSLPIIVRVVISRRMRWTGHVALMGGGERCVQGSGGET